MNRRGQGPRLVFDPDFDDRAEFETELRGYYALAHVVFADGSRYRITFYDPVRLAQDVEIEGLISDPGLVVLPKLTKRAMLDSVQRLERERFFDSLRPVSE